MNQNRNEKLKILLNDIISHLDTSSEKRNLLRAQLKEAFETETVVEQKTFKECFECYAKPGSPVMCKQCLWVRENYPPKEHGKTTLPEQKHRHCWEVPNTDNCSTCCECLKTIFEFSKEPSKQETGEETLRFTSQEWAVYRKGREDRTAEILEALPEELDRVVFGLHFADGFDDCLARVKDLLK